VDEFVADFASRCRDAWEVQASGRSDTTACQTLHCREAMHFRQFIEGPRFGAF
jgi:hypothetical protein